MLKYYLRDGSREKGPFMLDDLKYQRIRPDTQVKIDDGEWKPISAVDDLRFLMQLSRHKQNSASFAKPDHNKPSSQPGQVSDEARKRFMVAVAVAVLIAVMGMAMFFFMTPSN